MVAHETSINTHGLMRYTLIKKNRRQYDSHLPKNARYNRGEHTTIFPVLLITLGGEDAPQTISYTSGFRQWKTALLFD